MMGNEQYKNVCQKRLYQVARLKVAKPKLSDLLATHLVTGA